MRRDWNAAFLAILLLLLFAGPLPAQQLTVTGQITLVASKGPKSANRSAVVVWLTPLDETADLPRPVLQERPRLVQKGKRFEPHVLVVPAGTAVEFPNRDPFFHNVFSLFEGKRFDLGLYEAGTTRTVRFDRPGVSYIFCNIHPEMSAVVIALKTPYWGMSDASGVVRIANVPAGRYEIEVWHEGSSAATLKALSREVTIAEGESSLGTLRVVEDSPVTAHKNKYGRDYDTPTSQKSEYGPN